MYPGAGKARYARPITGEGRPLGTRAKESLTAARANQNLPAAAPGGVLKNRNEAPASAITGTSDPRAPGQPNQLLVCLKVSVAGVKAQMRRNAPPSIGHCEPESRR
jgi:hypothetical protein